MENEFNRLFKNNLKINTRTISVKTLLSERNLSRINYKPYYQRNYVWDAKKATFFIESILLGTDIPPLIFFKSGKNIEVIDGRQRFETLKRFKESSFKLTTHGLMELKVLQDENFNTLNPEIKDAFLNTKVRLFEFEVVNEPRLSLELEDKIKKEIFRRYNTGITPINSMELDNAKYDEDSLTTVIKEYLESNKDTVVDIINCFFSNKKRKSDVTSSSIADFLRRYITLSHFPIYSYAGSGSRTDIRELLYEFITDNIEDNEIYFNNFISSVKDVIYIHKKISIIEDLDNKLIYECMLWAFEIMKSEGVEYIIDDNIFPSLIEHYKDNLHLYSLDGAHYYGSIVKRFEDTSSFFGKKYNFDFGIYIKKDGFSSQIKEMKQTEEDGLKRINVLDKLRVLKPEPSSEPIEEVVSDLNTNKYMLRPSYQRQERISIAKASSIIESILLGIYLPPIFIYKNKDGVKEVIDGQQRLLSILAFMGKQYLNEKGQEDYSKNNNFSLKGLKILTDLNGSKFSALPENLSEKIYDFDLNIIEIDYKLNNAFKPVDLFIRLNNKPYPIKENSFEMWNSTVSLDVIQKIKDITEANIDWFYLRVVKKDRVNDRMENEEMITVLSYLDHLESTNSPIKGVEFYLKQDRLNSRITNKSGISNFLNSLDSNPAKKKEFVNSINNTKIFIDKINLLLGDSNDKLSELNDMFNVKNITAFKRSLQDIYLLWMVIHKIDIKTIENSRLEIKSDCVELLKSMKNTESKEINEQYMLQFIKQVDIVIEKYSKPSNL
ncbi:TPA: DUF262 domain-containing protein [Vibrio parahaemolyticus]|uniref:DUF262 domain-containing protein n=2 Tax=Vibrio parahaemolyticus TaxID=670 RepID=UPI00046F57AD|nr:DUF262 domain-containing protein [Vibrio parahaemolyticus]MDW9223674.1 DUF262 domain-containing protein [Vibrio parahaemolyticus]TOG39602.1 DUF262 domain-containing protein [Vibrio parahaemolyticus]HAV1404232.1 DUF262 domain-containing protein [Vibrio parahaemolyticus]HAV1451536.1 DUF262 domain-containing protein [Vibrio parahaemolyticus]HBN6286972.1 DUF262 domain-containing protein [Vibrio parahaemolyticus]